MYFVRTDTLGGKEETHLKNLNTTGAEIQVFCDFDGTITKIDVIDYILSQLADPAWTDIEQQWLDGSLTSKECLRKQISLLRGNGQDIQELLSEVEIEKSFRSFSQWCISQRIPLYIVSDGLDIVIKNILYRENITVDGIWSNWFIEGNEQNKSSIAFPYTSEHPNMQCGICKCKVLSHTAQNTFKVVIGDGYSDRCWVNNADLVFAKAQLSEYCQNNSIKYIPFSTFDDITEHMNKITAQPEFIRKQ